MSTRKEDRVPFSEQTIDLGFHPSRVGTNEHVVVCGGDRYRRLRRVAIRFAAVREGGEISGLELNSYELLTLYDLKSRRYRSDGLAD